MPAPLTPDGRWIVVDGRRWRAALLSGDIDFAIDGVASYQALVEAGQIRALAVTSAQRSSALPDVPTVEEAGGPALKGFEATSWFGLLAPAGTPPAITERVAALVTAALHDPEIGGRFVEQGAQIGGGTPAQFAAVVEQERSTLEPVIRAAGIRAE